MRCTMLAATAALLAFALPAFADSVIIDDVEFDATGAGVAQSSVHEDAGPFKGSVTLNVTNTGAVDWGDFHFAVFSTGQDVTNVDFTDHDADTMTDLLPTVNGTPVSYTIAADGSAIDLFFYGTPILAGQSATIVVWTDNTVDQVPFFGTMYYPTPVPEPATMALLGLGLGA